MHRYIQTFNERRILIILVAIAIVSILFSAFSHWMTDEGNWWAWFDGAFQNFSTEMIGASVTFVFFNMILEKNNKKQALWRQLKSPNNTIAVEALTELRAEHTQPYEFIGLDIPKASLSGADFSQLDLTGSTFTGANLSKSNFSDSDLQFVDCNRANLAAANFENARLFGAEFEHADLSNAKLKRVKCNGFFSGANLCGADFTDAALEGASITLEICDTNTILPNGSRWLPDTDWERFTDRTHPKFWQPSWVKGQSTESN